MTIMKIVEQFVSGKTGNPELCEDVIVTTNDFVVVVDGATDKTKREYGGALGGRFAAEHIAHTFKSLAPEADIRACSRLLTDELLAALRKSSPGMNPSIEDGPSAVFVAYSAARKEVWRVGDCSWMTNNVQYSGNGGNDSVTSAARSALLRGLLLGGAQQAELAKADPGREMILPLLQVQHRFRNLDSAEPFAFAAVDGRTIPERFLETWHVETGQEIVLASDGYPKLMGS